MKTPTRILETALYVDDLDMAEAFYTRILGFEPVAKVDGRHVFFRCGDGILLLFKPDETQIPSQNPAMPVPTHGAFGPGHACFAATRDEIAQWKDHLISHKVEIEAEFDWPNGARSLYFRDPAGNSLEFAEPRLWG